MCIRDSGNAVAKVQSVVQTGPGCSSVGLRCECDILTSAIRIPDPVLLLAVRSVVRSSGMLRRVACAVAVMGSSTRAVGRAVACRGTV
eukprot:1741741-Prymnesium_polylepis.2